MYLCGTCFVCLIYSVCILLCAISGRGVVLKEEVGERKKEVSGRTGLATVVKLPPNRVINIIHRIFTHGCHVHVPQLA